MTKRQKQLALDHITKQIESCRVCKTGKIGKAVSGEGNADADIVFLGEAPGKTEAKTGRPFVGPAGKLLRKLIEDAGLDESDIYITSPVKYLPKYVTPTPKDIAHGKKHLMAQLDIIQPKIIVLMGAVAAFAMLDRRVSLSQEHGKPLEHQEKKYFITYHPAAPLHSPKVRKDLIHDFKLLKKYLGQKKQSKKL